MSYSLRLIAIPALIIALFLALSFIGLSTAFAQTQNTSPSTNAAVQPPQQQLDLDSNGTSVNDANALRDETLGNDSPGAADTTGIGSVGATTATGTPGLPNTGLGGNSAIALTVLVASAALAAGGTYILSRRFAR